jgi:type II secretory pathway pseudopilin PulG
MAELLQLRRKKGFTLVDVIVGVSLLLIVFLGIFTAYQLGLQVVGQSKNKIIATALANAELEKIRNLPYESIGVQGSFPSGVLVAENEVSQNNITFRIKRRVDYIIDPTDGIAQPQDPCPNDYKRAEVRVLSSGKFPIEIAMVTDIAPKNLAKECAEGGGILSVSAFDAFGNMVQAPLIEIKDPVTNATLKSASPLGGQNYFSLATSTYKVVVSKTGYSTERTYGTDEVTTPINPHPLVLEGQLTEISFSIDRLSSMNIETRGTQGLGYPVIHNVTFNLRGEKLIGHDTGGNPVYKYSQNHTTNGSGQATVSDLEWDSYHFSVVSPNLNLVEIESPPGSTTTQPVALAPNTNLGVRLILMAENSLLVKVKNLDTQEPVFSAQVRLYNNNLGYDVTQYTDVAGQTYFIPLQGAVYNIEVEAAGYASSSDQVLVSGQTLKTINLQQVE